MMVLSHAIVLAHRVDANRQHLGLTHCAGSPEISGLFDSVASSTSYRDEVAVMPPALSALLAVVAALSQSRATLHLEDLALRLQLAVDQQTTARPRLRPADRLF